MRWGLIYSESLNDLFRLGNFGGPVSAQETKPSSGPNWEILKLTF